MVALPANFFDVWGAQERLGLFCGKPISESNAHLFCSFDPTNTSRQLGLRSPVSAASYARRRTAARRRLIVDGAKRRPSRSSLYRRTTVLLKASLGSEQYHVTKSSIANR